MKNRCKLNLAFVGHPTINFDSRGWLAEVFRKDSTLAVSNGNYLPAQIYISETGPGIKRGPHEHQGQTDYFVFVNPRFFQLWLWDNRPEESTYQTRQVFEIDRMTIAVIPPGIVHGYWNRGQEPVTILNAPDRLYRGRGGKGQIDEIRHENDPDSLFKME